MTIVYDFGCSKLMSTKINRIFGASVLEYAAKVSYITDIVQGGARRPTRA